MGLGWTHNFDIYVQPDSDSFEGMASTSPRSGAASIAAMIVIRDLLDLPSSGTNTKPLDRMVIAAIVTRWMMDQLTGNVVRVVQPGNSESFIRTAGDTYEETGNLLAPNGSSSTLSRNIGGTYTMVAGDGTVMQFGAADLSTRGRVLSWTNAAGATATFDYDGTKLTTVTSTAASRALYLIYTGNLVSSVSDGQRIVRYEYDGASRLRAVNDPLSARTVYCYEVIGCASGISGTGRLIQIRYPSFPDIPFVANTYDSLGRVFEQRDAANNLTQAFFAGRRTEILEPSQNRHVWYFDGLGLPLVEIQDFGRDANGDLLMNRATYTTYDGQFRPVSVTLPEGNRTETSYDEWSNPTRITQIAKPGSGLSDLVQAFTYSSPVTDRENFRRLASSTDPRGNVTTYEYDAEGLLTAVRQPAVTRPDLPSPVRPVTSYTYTAIGLVSTETDPEGRITAYEYDTFANRIAEVIDSGPGRLNLRTSWTYDTVGNALSIIPPRGNVAGADPDAFKIQQFFDRRRRMVQAMQPATGSSTDYVYDADDRLTQTRVLAYDGVNRPTLLITTTSYWPTGQRHIVTDPSGNTVTYEYDQAERLERATSSSGRQIRYQYDVLSRIIAVRDAVSGPLDPSITVNRGNVVRERRWYTLNGVLFRQRIYWGAASDSYRDITYTYDGFDRLSRTNYPAASPTPASYEEYGYDENGNRTLHRTRAGQDIVMTHDALNRMLTRAVPANANAPAVTYTSGYDLVGRLLRLRQSTDAADVQYGYDTAGRLIRETRPDSRQIGYGRDADGNMSRLTWPTDAGNAFEATYVYDALGRATAIHEGADATGPRLALYGYDTASRRLALDRANNARTAWGWRPDGRVETLTHDFASGTPIVLTYLYNREGGVSARLLNDPTYQAAPPLQASTAYVTNALNQYTAVAAASLSYDVNGNLTSDGAVTYRYDVQNRLVGFTVSGGPTISYAYDPEGRRSSRTAGASTVSRFLYAAGQEIAEYTGVAPGTLSTRHVPGAWRDEPLVSITVSNNNRLWYHADAQGSVLVRSNPGGVVGTGQRFTYTPYGVTGAGSGNPPAFRWLGRRLEPSAPAGLYDMRARVYSATLGRFLQADPIGTDGGLNLYAYVGNDPLNQADPEGLSALGRLFGAVAASATQAATRASLEAARRRAVKDAWRMEQRLVRETGAGTVEWTSLQRQELLREGQVRGFHGHHINSVSAAPNMAGNPNNIQFLPVAEHHGLHRAAGGTRVPIGGQPLIDRSAGGALQPMQLGSGRSIYDAGAVLLGAVGVAATALEQLDPFYTRSAGCASLTCGGSMRSSPK